MKAELSGFSESGFQYIASKGFGATQAEVCCWIKGTQEASWLEIADLGILISGWRTKHLRDLSRTAILKNLLIPQILQNAEIDIIFLIYCLENLYNTVSCWDPD